MPPIELIVRALIRRRDTLLLAHKKGEPNTFLPGGHIEPGEYSEEALRRELREELDVDALIGGFVGVLEHKFTDRHGKWYEEINLIFEAEIKEAHPRSAEGHLEFMWCPIRELGERTLLPSSLPRLIDGYMEEGKPFHYSQVGE